MKNQLPVAVLFSAANNINYADVSVPTFWTNRDLILDAGAKINQANYREVVARTKIMTVMASGLQTEDRIHDVSVLFADGSLSEHERHRNYFGTATSVFQKDTDESPQSIKERLYLQLSEHELVPRNYRLKDGSRAIEFDNHPSRLVCIFDDDSIQVMWEENRAVKSEVVLNETINFYKILQKIAVTLTTTDTPKKAAIVQQEKFIFA